MSGWNKPTEKPVETKKAAKPTLKHGLIAGGVVAVLGCVLLLVFSGGDGAPKAKAEKKPGVIKEVKPVARTATNAVSETQSDAATAQKTQKRIWQGSEIVREKVFTNDTTVVETYWTADGKKHKYIHSTVKPVFENGADQVLALATADTTGNGPPLPGLGKNFEDRFGKAVQKEIVINDDDSDDVKEVKQRVIEARKNLLAAMSEGRRAEDVIAEDRAVKQEETALRNVAVEGLKEYLRNGDAEGAAAYCEQMNKKLDEMGLMRIEIPQKRGKVR